MLSVGPFYNKPTQQGFYEHFKAIAEAEDIPIIVYNVPGRTNETWVRAEKLGRFYGQCSELCGVDHSFMPIFFYGCECTAQQGLNAKQGEEICANVCTLD